jgi:hypothetical protein
VDRNNTGMLQRAAASASRRKRFHALCRPLTKANYL